MFCVLGVLLLVKKEKKRNKTRPSVLSVLSSVSMLLKFVYERATLEEGLHPGLTWCERYVDVIVVGSRDQARREIAVFDLTAHYSAHRTCVICKQFQLMYILRRHNIKVIVCSRQYN